jgi:hypothetical protein
MQLAAELFTVEWQCQTGSCRLLEKSASGVLAQRLNIEESFTRVGHTLGLSVHQDPFWANGHTKCGLYLHASSLVVSC